MVACYSTLNLNLHVIIDQLYLSHNYLHVYEILQYTVTQLLPCLNLTNYILNMAFRGQYLHLLDIAIFLLQYFTAEDMFKRYVRFITTM